MPLFAGDEFSVFCEPSDTILDLKKIIEEEEGYDPERQKLFKYFISLENHWKIENCLKDGDTLSLSLPTASSKPIAFESDKENFILHGHSKNFSCQLLIPDRPEKLKLKSSKFGVVYRTEGEVGNRIFYVRRYELPKKMKDGIGCIQLRTEDNNIKVVLVIDEGPNGEEMYLDDVESKAFSERENNGSTSLKDALSSGASLAEIFSEIAQGVCAFLSI